MTTTFLVAGEDADMVIGFQSGEMYLALQKELPIGSPISVAYWLKDQYQAEGEGINLLCPTEAYPTFSLFQKAYNEFKVKAAAARDVNAIKQLELYVNVSKHLAGKIPSAALHIMISAILAEVVITDLIFQRKEETIGQAKVTTTKAKLGLAINFAAPLVLLPNLAVRKIALLIMYASNGDLEHFPVRDATQLPSPEPNSIPAEGWIDFGDHTPVENDKLILDGADWTFAKKGEGDVLKKTTGIGDDKDVILTELVKNLNELQDGKISQCKYKLEGTKLKIVAQAGGAARNSFTLAVNPVAVGTLSGATLAGGVGVLKENVPVPA